MCNNGTRATTAIATGGSKDTPSETPAKAAPAVRSCLTRILDVLADAIIWYRVEISPR